MPISRSATTSDSAKPWAPVASEEARSILNKAVGTKPNSSSEQGLGSRIQAHFAQLGRVELVLPERSSGPEPAQFNGEKPLCNHNSLP